MKGEKKFAIISTQKDAEKNFCQNLDGGPPSYNLAKDVILKKKKKAGPWVVEVVVCGNFGPGLTVFLPGLLETSSLSAVNLRGISFLSSSSRTGGLNLLLLWGT